MTNFNLKLQSLENQYNINNKEGFNIFNVMHHKFDERRLHSRFIATLLNPKGTHHKKNLFLNKFLEIIDLPTLKDSEHIEVLPDVETKKEWENIDIFIKAGNRLIIIENKIFAGDSNKKLEEGIYQAQLVNYFEKVQSTFNLNGESINQSVTLIYLTPNRKAPSLLHQIEELNLNLHLIDYIQTVPLWLKSCLSNLEDSYLKSAIKQYLELVTSITNDIEFTFKFRELISENLNEAFDIVQIPKTNINYEFTHVKWHTVHEFWQSLAFEINKNFDVACKCPSNKLITTLTHTNAKRNLLLEFDYKGQHIYIANDVKGFTWGIINPKIDVIVLKKFGFKILENKVWKNILGLENITFSNFQNINTFSLIKYTNREKVINLIISELLSVLKLKHSF